jgi:hypothetical protein
MNPLKKFHSIDPQAKGLFDKKKVPMTNTDGISWIKIPQSIKNFYELREHINKQGLNTVTATDAIKFCVENITDGYYYLSMGNTQISGEDNNLHIRGACITKELNDEDKPFAMYAFAVENDIEISKDDQKFFRILVRPKPQTVLPVKKPLPGIN